MFFAVLSRRQAVVDDQRQHDIARGRLPVRDVFAPAATKAAVALDPLAGVAAILAFVPKTAARLVRAMIGRARGSSRGKAVSGAAVAAASQKTDRLIESARFLLCSNPGMAGQDQDVATDPIPQFLDESRVERRVLPSQIHLTNHGAAGGGIGFIFARANAEMSCEKREKQSGEGRLIMVIISSRGAMLLSRHHTHFDTGPTSS